MGTQLLHRIALIFLAMWGLAQLSPAARAENTYSGKTITYIVATKPGGGYDTYARLIAKYLEKHLPGSTVVVKNVPGAGHRAGIETLYASPPDGLTIATFNLGLLYGQLAGQFEKSLDFRQFSYLGAAALESRVVMVRMDSRFKSVEELGNGGQPIKIAVNGKNGAANFESSLLAKLLGWNLVPIFGYEGSEGEVSLLRGDVDLLVGTKSSLQHYVDSGEARILMEYGGKSGTAVPHPAGQVATSEQLDLWHLIEFTGRFSRVTAAPPNMPPDRLEELRKAYGAALADPDLKVEADRLSLPIDPSGGEELADALANALNQRPAVIEIIKEILVAE